MFKNEIDFFKNEADIFRSSVAIFRSEIDTLRSDADTFRNEIDTFRSEIDSHIYLLSMFKCRFVLFCCVFGCVCFCGVIVGNGVVFC